MYSKNCPSCQEIITYDCKVYLDKSIKNNSVCKKCYCNRKSKHDIIIDGYKSCSKCKVQKTVDNFTNSKKSQSGLQSICKQCKKEQKQSIIEKNNNRTSYPDKKCIGCGTIKNSDNFSKHSHSSDGLTSRCKQCEKEKQALYLKAISGITNKSVPLIKVCRTCKKSKSPIDFTKDKNKLDGLDNQCILCKKEHNKKYKKCYKDLPLVEKIRDRVRLRIRKYIKNKPMKTKESLGCSIKELMEYLENRFYPNPDTNEKMTWDNYGFYGWHIDHIIPLSHFNLHDKEQYKKACHYSNLQPLWAKENLSKGNRLPITKLS